MCHELNLPQTALDILMFLANNPQYRTARDIVEVRKIKANLVSVHVDRLVKEGYLERRKEDSCRKNLRSNGFLVWMKRCSDRWKKWSDEWNRIWMKY